MKMARALFAGAAFSVLSLAITPASAQTTADSAAPLTTGAEDIVVTAQKRTERALDVPVPVSVLSADVIASAGARRIEDFYTKVPGLSIGSSGTNYGATITVRGISTGGFGYPTVGVVLDDVPVTSATTYGGGIWAPDIDPTDLSRFELLRGPQGTLYGANSMGGLVKYVTVNPSTEGVSGSVRGGIIAVSHGDDVGYNLQSSLNLPVTDTVAVRVSGFTRREPGFIDNPFLGVKDINTRRSNGLHFSAIWRPSDNFSVKLGALTQSASDGGYRFVKPSLGGEAQDFIRGAGEANLKNTVYSMNMTANLGGVTLNSITGYVDRKLSNPSDLSLPYFGPFVSQPNFGVSGALLQAATHNRKFTQELRLSTEGRLIDFMVGGFFTTERSLTESTLNATDPQTGQVAGELAFIPLRSRYREFAGFANATIHVTDRFDVQVGGRYSTNRQTYQETDGGLLFGGTIVGPTFRSKLDAFTYLFTPRFKISSDVMIYGRFASGYRPGGPNTTVRPDVPTSFKPDYTNNYEIGTKGKLFDGALIFDASLYLIDWKDIQVSTLSADRIAAYFINGPRARSQGAELSLESHPAQGLVLSGWLSYSDAKLTRDFPALGALAGRDGDRLPDTGRWSGSISADQSFALTADADLKLGATFSFVGSRLGDFQAAGVARERYPSYSRLDLRASVDLNDWTIEAYVNNVANGRGILVGGANFFLPNYFQRILPRTVGLSLARRF